MFNINNVLRIGYKVRKISILRLFVRIYMRIFFPNSIISTNINIGEGTTFVHRGIGVVIHDKAVIGRYCKIMQNVTIGGRNGRGAPTIGDYCFIGAGACILGNITIGDDVMIGANAVVTKDIPSGTIWGGVPAKYIKDINPTLVGKEKN